MHNAFLQKAVELKEQNIPFATAYIVRRTAPSSGKPGDKAIITSEGKIYGWIGGGCTRGIVLKEAIAAINDGKTKFVSISKDQKVHAHPQTKIYAMTCQSGGEVEVYIEPVLPKPKILIFGKSHIAMAIVKLAKAMDYKVDVVMHEVDKHVFPEADDHHDLSNYQDDQFDKSSYSIVCTQGEGDVAALKKAIDLNGAYLAFVSSRKKANSIYKELRELGITFDQLKKIKTPAGLDIKAKVPEEVAISILAEIVQHFREPQETESAVDQKVSEVAIPSDEFYINPVCQIPVQKNTAKHVLEHKGDKVYFCCDGCKVSFEADPYKYIP